MSELIYYIFSSYRWITFPSTTLRPHKKTFTWEKLNYHVPSPNGPLRLLHDVYGYVKPGTLTALMGASGAGTFNVLSLWD